MVEHRVPCAILRPSGTRAEKGFLLNLGFGLAVLETAAPIAPGDELDLSFTLGATRFDGVRATAEEPQSEGPPRRFSVRFAPGWSERVQEAVLRPRHQAVLLVDDDPELRGSVETCLREAGYTVLAVGTAAHGIAAFAERPFDLAILDLSLPDDSGLKVLESIRAHPKRFATPAIVFTADARLESKLAGLAIGADHYLNKPVDSHELLLWVGALLRRVRTRNTAKGVIAFERGEIDPGAHLVRLGMAEFAHLSRKEFDLLYSLIAERPRVLSKKYILSNLWHTVVTDNTVEVHINRLREKLGPEGAHRIVTVPGKGYKFV